MIYGVIIPLVVFLDKWEYLILLWILFYWNLKTLFEPKKSFKNVVYSISNLFQDKSQDYFERQTSIPLKKVWRQFSTSRVQTAGLKLGSSSWHSGMVSSFAMQFTNIFPWRTKHDNGLSAVETGFAKATLNFWLSILLQFASYPKNNAVSFISN